jgi:hypothetical protein
MNKDCALQLAEGRSAAMQQSLVNNNEMQAPADGGIAGAGSQVNDFPIN